MAEIGARPLIRLSKSCIGESEKRAVMGVLDREYLGMGKEVEQFEKALEAFFGRPAVCVVNGTAALHLSIQACGLGPGDEVLVPSLTYVASYQAISATGARPVSCDIEESSLVMDWRDAERRITPRTRAVMPVHYSGGVGDLDAIHGLARRYGLRIIEDAAHAFGSTYRQRRVGGFGDIACFSFDGIKNITSGEGGCIVTDDERLLSCVRDARLLGVQKDTERRFLGQRSWAFEVASQGWRYHMSNLMAAIGLMQLQRLPEFSLIRRERALRYDALLGGHPRICPLLRNYGEVVPHIYVVRIKGLENREKLQATLLDKGIQTGIHYQPNHLLQLYRNDDATPLPVTEAVFPELLTLPLHPDLSEQDVDYICRQLKLALG